MGSDRTVHLCVCKVTAENEQQKESETDRKGCQTVCVALFLKKGTEKTLGEELGGVE